MTVVYINAVQYQTCPNHESDNHFFAKIPGGGSRPPVPTSGSALDVVNTLSCDLYLCHVVYTIASCDFQCYASFISSAVFRENVRYCHNPEVVICIVVCIVIMKSLIFHKASVIMVDVYLSLREIVKRGTIQLSVTKLCPFYLEFL